MRIIQILILALIVNFFGCSQPSSAFKTKTIYMVDGFSELTLSGFLICTGPIFNKQGIDIIDSMNANDHFQQIADIRRDLNLISLMQVKEKLIHKIGRIRCDSLFSILSKDSIIQMQLMDSLWQLIDCDFLMVMRIKDAMSIKTFDKVEKKRIRIEAELWKCKDQEIIWRKEIYGIADGKRATDRDVINMTIRKAYQELPQTVPSYESGRW